MTTLKCIVQNLKQFLKDEPLICLRDSTIEECIEDLEKIIGETNDC